MKIKCINDLGSKDLTVNKEYTVTAQGKTWIEIINDSNKKYTYLIDAFEFIKDDKSKNFKEYTLQEVFKMSVGTKLKLFPYDENEREIIIAEGVAGNKYLYYLDSEGYQDDGVIISSWLMDKPVFKVIKEPVSFIEAITSGKRIKVDITDLQEKYTQGCYCVLNGYWNNTYFKIPQILEMLSNCETDERRNRIILEGKWYIED
jgi:hypothetical protein